MWILGADADDEASEASVQAVQARIEGHGGELLRTQGWGRRSLAYPIRHNGEGVYNVAQFTMEADAAAEFERDIRADQAIIRHIQLRIEESDLLPDAEPEPMESEAAGG